MRETELDREGDEKGAGGGGKQPAGYLRKR